MMLMILGEPLPDLRRGLHSIVSTSFKVKVLACPTGKVVLIPDLVDDVGVWESLEVLLLVVTSKFCPR
jgi:hypothetical protein